MLQPAAIATPKRRRLDLQEGSEALRSQGHKHEHEASGLSGPSLVPSYSTQWQQVSNGTPAPATRNNSGLSGLALFPFPSYPQMGVGEIPGGPLRWTNEKAAISLTRTRSTNNTRGGCVSPGGYHT